MDEPRLFADANAIVLRSRICDFCGKHLLCGKFWQPVAHKYIWVCHRCRGKAQ